MKYSMGRNKIIAALSHVRPMGRRLIVIALLWFGCLGIANAGDSEIYYWKDDKGVQHFSNLPPETPVENLGRALEIPHDPSADQARMKEDAEWLKQEAQRAEAERQKAAAEKAAEEEAAAAEKRLAAERQKALEEEQRQAEAARVQAREQRRSTADKSVFVNPGNKIPGINGPSKPTPLPSKRD